MGTGASKKIWDNLLVIVAFGVILLVSGRSYPQVAGARTRTVTRRDLFPWNHAIIATAPEFANGAWNPFGIVAKNETGQQGAEAPRFEVDPFWPKHCRTGG
jgi:hypothetical protein